MNEKRIGKIVRKVHRIANENCVSDAKSALATYVEEEIFKNHKKSISYRTIERTFDKYIDGKEIGSPIAENVDLLCKFLGCKDYTDYVRRQKRRRLIITVGIAFGVMLATTIIFKNQIFNPDRDSSSNSTTIENPVNPNTDSRCMTWADSLYISVPCDEGPYSKYGTQVKPLDRMELKNMKKVEVRAGYPFFTEEGKPRIWYYRNKNNEFEYFTAPGFHPVNEETLRKITEGVIDKYVPTHLDNKDSFLE